MGGGHTWVPFGSRVVMQCTAALAVLPQHGVVISVGRRWAIFVRG
jgi:hypothetical protein